MKRNILISFAVTITVSLQSLNAQTNPRCMEASKSNENVSCKLTTPELQQRKQAVIGELKKLVLEKVETGTGFRYRFDGSDVMLDKLNMFIKTERLCCDFFEFTLSVSGDARTTWLEISGSAEAKQFILSELEF